MAGLYSPPMAPTVTRLAPSPTGHLHLGHAWSFLCTWALARSHGWSIRLRLEDLDASRASADAREDALWCLRWLDIDWDGEPELQSDHAVRHHQAMHALAAQGLVFKASEVHHPRSSRPSIPPTSKPTRKTFNKALHSRFGLILKVPPSKPTRPTRAMLCFASRRACVHHRGSPGDSGARRATIDSPAQPVHARSMMNCTVIARSTHPWSGAILWSG
jgi:hypothetical protein